MPRATWLQGVWTREPGEHRPVRTAVVAPGAVVLGLLAACGKPGEQDRSALRDAILLDDGRTAVVSYSSRQVRQVLVRRVPLGADGGGMREETVRHHTVLGRFDLATKVVTRLAAFDLGSGNDADHMQLLWSLGDFVLLHGPFPERQGVQFDYALLDARTGALERLRLQQFAEENQSTLFDVRLVAADGSVAVITSNARPGGSRRVWLRRPTGAFERLCDDGRLEGCSRDEVAFQERGAGGRSAFRFVDGRRRELHAREYENGFAPTHQERPRLLQVRGLPGLGHGAQPPGGPYLALARRESGRWTEDEVPIDVGPLR